MPSKVRNGKGISKVIPRRPLGFGMFTRSLNAKGKRCYHVIKRYWPQERTPLPATSELCDRDHGQPETPALMSLLCWGVSRRE